MDKYHGITHDNKYHGITHNIGNSFLDNENYCQFYKEINCKKGVHLFDEVWSLEEHYLHCDICGLEVHISKIMTK